MKTITIKWLFASTLLSVTLCAQAANGDHPQDAWTARVDVTFNRGQADGFLQTPAGGKAGTSSYHRPTLDELNVDDVDFYDAQGSIQRRHLNLYLGYQSIALHGNATLSENLTSRSIAFSAHTRVHTETDLQWIRAGAGWKFELLGDRLELVPKAEYAMLDFNYKLEGGGQRSDRNYNKGAVRLELESRYRLNRVISVGLNIGRSLPISNTPQIMAITGGFEFNLPGSGQVQPHLFLGGGAQQIEYEDDQELPNHFRVEIKPFFAAGVGLSF